MSVTSIKGDWQLVNGTNMYIASLKNNNASNEWRKIVKKVKNLQLMLFNLTFRYTNSFIRKSQIFDIHVESLKEPDTIIMLYTELNHPIETLPAKIDEIRIEDYIARRPDGSILYNITEKYKGERGVKLTKYQVDDIEKLIYTNDLIHTTINKKVTIIKLYTHHNEVFGYTVNDVFAKSLKDVLVEVQNRL